VRQGEIVRKLVASQKAFWDALCDAQAKLTDGLEPVVCLCGSRRLAVIHQERTKSAVTRRRRCNACGRIVLTAEFVVARRVSDGKSGSTAVE
jgi:hypothetical protein